MHQHMTMPDWMAALADCGDSTGACESVEDSLTPERVGCSDCMTTYEELDRVVEQAAHFDPMVAIEWWQAGEQIEALRPLTLAERLATIETDDSFLTWGLCRRLLQVSYEARLEDPNAGLEAATVAVAIADRLDDERYHSQWVADLRAVAHAYLANAWRVLGRYPEAEREFRASEGHLAHGVGGGKAENECVTLEASLFIDQRRYSEAEALLNRVESFYRRHDDREALVRVLLKSAKNLCNEGRLPEAIEVSEEATRLASSLANPGLRFLAEQNVVMYVLESDQVARARAIFEALPEPPTPKLAVQRLWVQGELLREEGRLDEAWQAFKTVQKAFQDAEMHYDVAILAVDLAVVALMKGESAQVGRLVEEMNALLTRAAAPFEAFVVLQLLLASVEQDALSVAYMREVAKKLQSLRPAG